ncbi:protein kinase [Alphaproteobacteria bacterium KMM 3653]|uniref:Protein kinase n=1 Tax=Harenicola maris TaxID=2841044 RepID=A0AAP2G894_9RHOB|nr:protein kinase [Harenicola maris]
MAEGDNEKTVIGSVAPTGVAIGTQIMGTFEIKEHIATGGMGEVYRGINIHTGESVAIKIVLAALAHDEKIISLFQKEATVLGRLHHDAIVRYQLFTIDPGIQRACLVMEFVEGRAMADYIEDGAMPIEDVRTMISRVASGLTKAHDLGVVHRDLSPDNVIIQDGQVSRTKIIDFGIAKSANFGGGTLLGGQFAGKYNYVSPEQLGRFKGVITGQSDIYSLALVAAAACKGEPLDMGDNPAEAVERRLEVPDLSGVYDEIRPLLEMMLQPNPADRPTDMAQVLEFVNNPALIPMAGGAAAPAGSIPPVGAPGTQPPAGISQPPQYGFTTPPQGSYPGSVPPPPTGDNESPFGNMQASAPPSQITGLGSTLPPPHTTAPTQPEAKKKGKAPMVVALVALLAAGGGAGAYFTGALDSILNGGEVALDPVIAAADAVLAEDRLMAQFARSGSLSETDLLEVEGLHTDVRTRLFASLGLPGASADLAALEGAVSGRAAEIEARASREAQSLFDRMSSTFEADGTYSEADIATARGMEPATQSKLFDLFELPEGETTMAALEQALQQRVVEDGIRRAAERAAKAKEAATSTEAALTEKLLATGELSAIDLNAVRALSDEARALLLESIDLGEGQLSIVGLTAAMTRKVKPETTETDGGDAAITEPDTGLQTDTGEVVDAQTPTDPDFDRVIKMVEWVRNYSQPPCVYTSVMNASDTSIALEGYATTIDPFWQLLADFQRAHGVEPDIEMRTVNESQCQVINFLRNMADSPAATPRLTLDKDVLKQGEHIVGKVSNLEDREIWLFLVDYNGGVYNISKRLSPKEDGTYTFSLKLSLPTLQAGAFVPQLIVAVATDVPLKTIDVPDGTTSTVLMPIVQADIRRNGVTAASGAAYFRFDTE